MPLTTRQKLGSIGVLAILTVPPSFAGPQDDGLWSQPFESDWPLKNINSLLTTPQGNILSIGVTGGGVGGTEFKLDVWNPELGTGAGSHNNINNDVPDIGHYSSVLMPGTDNVLITGGTDNYFTTGTDIGSFIFNTQTNTLTVAANSAATSQQSLRSDTSTTVLPSGEILVGGTDLQREIYSPSTNQWRTLTGADKGNVGWVFPNGEALVSGFGAATNLLDPSGNGSLTPTEEISPSAFRLFSSPSGTNPVMYRPGKFFYSTPSAATTIGITTVNGRDIFTRGTNSRPSYPVLFSPKTILLPTGNAITVSSITSSPFTTTSPIQLEIWDAATESWSLMVNNEALSTSDTIALLKDGRVLVLSEAGEARSFSPPYLFNDSGNLAERPELISAPEKGSYAGRVTVKHGTGNVISRVTLVSVGRFDDDRQSVNQRFIELDFDDIADGVNVTLPESANIATPGYYIMYLIDNQGAPSEGHIISLSAAATNTSTYPVAAADYVTATGSGIITIDALANDTGSGLTLNAPNAWSLKGGIVSLVSNKVTYKPKAGFNGEDKIWYTFSDAQGRSNSGVIVITVSGNGASNSYPTATQDNVTVTTSTQTTIDVLANDTGDGLVLNQPNAWSLNGGSVALVGNKLVYTSKSGFSGNDNIWYTFKDSQGRGNSGQVNITVKSGSSTAYPVAYGDYYTTAQNSGMVLDILANDSGSGWKGIDTLYQYTAKGGTSYKTPEGKVWYTPKAGFTGEDNFWYVMIDSLGRKNSAQVKINVTQ